MALRVSYKNRIGYYTKTEKWKDEPERNFKIRDDKDSHGVVIRLA